MSNLLHFEQRVNDRFGTSSAPRIADSLLPEAGALLPLKWRKVPADEALVLGDRSSMAEKLESSLRRDDYILIPVHPIDEKRWPADSLLTGGAFRVCASYRTVAYVPCDDDFLSCCIPEDQTLMIKLHLSDPLPGVLGDRRLTRDKIEKCVLLSQELREAMLAEPMAEQLRIIPEFLGVAADGCGALFRSLPSKGVIPVFSLGSIDSSQPDHKPLILKMLEERYGDNAVEAAVEFGDQFARPLIRSLLAGFRAGFSLEMHAQNTLIEPGKNRLISTVFYRDLEGVIFSNAFRSAHGLPELFTGMDNSELTEPGRIFSRYFSRNYDHDLGRIFRSVLRALHSSGYFDRKRSRVATDGIRETFRSALREAQLADLAGAGSVVPFSRAPYGNGLRLGHYFRTRFR